MLTSRKFIYHNTLTMLSDRGILGKLYDQLIAKSFSIATKSMFILLYLSGLYACFTLDSKIMLMNLGYTKLDI